MGLIGIVGAMDVEVEPQLAALKDARPWRRAGMDFVRGTLDGRPVVVAHAGVGKVNAGICGYVLAGELGCDAVIFSGVAGSLDPRVHVLDVVVSTECAYYDVDARNFGYKLGEVPQLGVATFAADPQLRVAAVAAARRAVPERRVFEGLVASGDTFIRTDERRREVREALGALCCEMEGTAVAQACWLCDVPFVVVRAISDEANGFEANAYNAGEEQAAQIAARIVRSMISGLS